MKKKIEFVSIWQLVAVAVFSIMSVVCFISMFYNPIHILNFIGSLAVAVASYKEKNW